MPLLQIIPRKTDKYLENLSNVRVSTEERNMLVLARKHGQSIYVGDEVEITIVEVRGDVVRLGINAPGGILVYRKEVWEKIRAERENNPDEIPPDSSPS